MAYFNKADLRKLIVPGETPVCFFRTANVSKKEFKTYPEEIQNQYEYDAATCLYNLPTQIWAKHWRVHGPYWFNKTHPEYIKHCIGGSDMGYLYDGSLIDIMWHFYEGAHGANYKCLNEILDEKRGLVCAVKEASSSDAVLFAGHNLEEACIRDFEYRYRTEHPTDEIEIINDTHLFQCGRKKEDGTLLLPFCVCNIDRLIKINGMILLGECKVIRRQSPDYELVRNGIVPVKYRLQLAWYMLCLNLPAAYICFKTGLDPSETYYVYVERDFYLENLLIETAQDFVSCIESGNYPALKSGQANKYREYVRRQKALQIIPDALDVTGNDKYISDVIEIEKMLDEKKKKKDELSKIEEQIKIVVFDKLDPVMGDNNVAIATLESGEQLKVTRSKALKDRKLNIKNFKKAYPDLYKNYRSEAIDEKRLFTDHPELLQIEDILAPPELSTGAGNVTVKHLGAKKKGA